MTPQPGSQAVVLVTIRYDAMPEIGGLFGGTAA
jgi:hypothetical protein